MRKTVGLFALLTVGCAPSASELLQLGTWSAEARKSCTTPGHCPEPRACIAAVVEATKPGAGRRQYSAAETACWAYRGTP